MTPDTNKPIKVYIASSLANYLRVQVLRDRLALFNIEVTHDWTEHSPWVGAEKPLRGESARNQEDKLREAAHLDRRGVLDADVVIGLLPGGVGSHTELGMALGRNIPVILYAEDPTLIWGYDEDTPHHTKAPEYTCAFYHEPGVTQVTGKWDSNTIGDIAMMVNTLAATSRKSLTLSEMVAESFTCALTSGWWDRYEWACKKSDPSVKFPCLTADEKLSKLMLMVTELAEAAEEIRNGTEDPYYREDGKPEGVAAELADVVIRIGDYCGALGIDLEATIKEKMKFNRSRSYRHGGKKA